MTDTNRIVLEQADDGERWRIRSEHPDVQLHELSGGLTLQPDGQDDSGQPLYRIDSGDDDAEGHRYSRSDRRLKRNIRAI